MATTFAAFGSRRVRQIAAIVAIAAMLLTALFALRTYASFALLRSAYAAGAPITSSIRPWMTLDYVAVTYHVPGATLIERLGLSTETDPKTSLRSLARPAGVSFAQYVERVQRAIADLAPNVRSDQANGTSGWLGTLGDQVLTAMLVYGYPVLGLTLLLCAIGMPLPDGVATTVAGSLIAQGRMDWALAGAVVVGASLLGDAISYGLGHLLGREILERHGRWLGYSSTRRVRVQLLFEQWGSLTVFLTRTFMSYLSPVASLLAGVSRYRLWKFLTVALGGRLVWASAYLSLGYAIGADWTAATSFLTNLSLLVLSLLLLMGAGMVTSGRKLSASQVL